MVIEDLQQNQEGILEGLVCSLIVMAKRHRDDFPQKIINKLRDRVAHRCSNPACRVPTSGPVQSDPEKAVNIGKAAHICAAAPKGPRYDASMSKEQRKGINNAIWLCAGCADKIDKDAAAFPVELLKKWKTTAEKAASDEINTRLPAKSDAMDTVVSALTGTPKSVLLESVQNVCLASSKSLEQLDPRFSVITSHSENITQFKLLAKENVDFKLKVGNTFGDEFCSKFNRLIDHGEPLEIDSQAIRIEGSGLLEYISNDAKDGKIILSTNMVLKGVQKLWLRDTESNECFYVDDILGDITAGKETFNFVGSAYRGILEIKYASKFASKTSGSLNFTLNVDTDKWKSHPITALPFFEKIRKLFSMLSSGCELNTKLEVDGKCVFSGNNGKLNSVENIQYYEMFCDYLHLASLVLRHFNREVTFDHNINYSRPVHDLLLMLSRVLNGDCIVTEDIEANATCTFVAEENLENIQTILKYADEPRAVKYEQGYGGVIELFGETLQLPRSYFVITRVIPAIHQKIEDIRPGDEVVVEWIPLEGCEFVTGLIDDTFPASA